jgi:glycosyltransferase involved in cell wall biosynthesis
LVVHTVHGWSLHQHQRRWVRTAAIRAERLAARWCDVLVVLAESDRRKGLDAGIGRPEQYVLIRSGIDLEPFRASRERASVRAELQIADDTALVGTVSRLTAQKDPLTLIRAASIVKKAFDEVRFVFVGDGPLRTSVVQEIDELNLNDVVLLLGARDDVPRLVSAFDVFALSSRWEGLPRVVPEAMAAGVPVVATNVDGTSEIVEDGVTGLLVRDGEPDALASALVRLLRDRAFAERLAAVASQRAGDWEAAVMVDRLVALYRSRLAQGRRDRTARASRSARPARRVGEVGAQDL